ncbi:MAG: hypothetical protein Q8K82_05265 [Gemmatimonadaceae bacterium]|nr:hypothetical protein [Gemmatimonadaceae bacterium]
MAKRRKEGARAPARVVNAKDTAVTPLRAEVPWRRLWLLLGVVVVLAIAAILTVFRPW